MKGEWSRYDYGIKVTRCQQLVIITINRRVFFCDLASGSEPRFVHIAEPGKANSGNAQERSHQLLTATANADDAKIDLVGRRFCPQVSGFRQKQSTTKRFCCAANKFASIHPRSSPLFA